MGGVLSFFRTGSSSLFRSKQTANQSSLCRWQQRLALLVVLSVLNPTRCGLLVLTSCAKCYQETGMHQTLLMSGSWLGNCHLIHGHAHMQGNQMVVCVMVVQLVFAVLQSQLLGLLGPVLGTGLPVQWCNCWQRVMQS